MAAGLPPELLIKKATKKESTVPAITPEETAATEASLTEMADKLPSILFNDPPKKAPEVKAPEVKAPEVKAPETPTPAPAKPEKHTRKAPDALEIARVTAEQTAKTLAEKWGPTPAVIKEPAAPDPLAKLSADDRDTYEAFKYLSENDSKYKNRHTEFLKFVDELASYKKQWQRDNAGRAFDPDDSEHERFYEDNQPDYDDTDIDRARIHIEADKRIEKRLTEERHKMDERLADVESKAMSTEVQREAQESVAAVTSTFVEAIADEATKQYLAKGVDALKEADPVAFEVLDTTVAQLQEQVVELHHIVKRPRYFNPANPVHNSLAAFTGRQEQLIAQLPPAQQVFEGRAFATREQLAAMSPSDRNRYWSLTEQDVVHMLTQSATARANSAIAAERQRLETMAAKYGFVKGPASKATPAAAAATPAVSTASAAKPIAPTSGVGDPTAPAGTPSPKGDEPVEKKLVGMLF